VFYASEPTLPWLARTEHPFPRALAGHTLGQLRPTNAFETALLVLSLLHIGCALEDLAMAESIGAAPSQAELRWKLAKRGVASLAPARLLSAKGRS